MDQLVPEQRRGYSNKYALDLHLDLVGVGAVACHLPATCLPVTCHLAGRQLWNTVLVASWMQWYTDSDTGLLCLVLDSWQSPCSFLLCHVHSSTVLLAISPASRQP
jgi:hypothetical protein